MPFYEYQCTSCRFYTEVLQKITDSPLRKCPSCGRNTLKKLMSAPVFRLKGAGWYETDFKSDKEEKRNLADREEPKESTAADSKAPESKATESKAAESKPEAAESKAKPAEKSGESAAGKPSTAARTPRKTAAAVRKPASSRAVRAKTKTPPNTRPARTKARR
jgi:putative FmdB family regulatory protein